MRLRRNADLAALAALAYLPFVLSDPGEVSADSKQALYLDPGSFLSRAVELWNPHVGAGGVPHQEIGYLVPMGPWFWLFEQLGAPDWVAQRLWLGTLSLSAGLGARWLFRLLGVRRGAAFAGALVYLLAPYQLAFTARMSVLLLPWAALPWLVGLTMRAVRRGGWRDPALLALALVLTGGVNASSLALVAVGPLLWVLVEVARRPDRARSVGAAALRIGALAVGVSLWWLAGLRLQGAYGLPVLQLTENVRTVAEASNPVDVLRGLGNWFFTGRDRTGYAVDQAADYVADDLVVTLTLLVPAAGIVAAFLLRWTHRTFFALLVVVGTVLAVGAWPHDDPSPFGALWKSFTSDTSVGLALRNSPRAVPLIVLGWAGLLAGAVSAVPREAWSRLAGGAVTGIAVLALLPVWQQGYLTDGMLRPESIPAHWRQAAAAMDRGDPHTRVLEVPGSAFAAYTWGTTVDPVTPGLIERDYLAREVLPAGTPGTVNLLDALDRRLQLGTFDPAALAPVSRLLAVGTVVFRGDLEHDGRFDTPDPADVWASLQPAPPGTDLAEKFDGPEPATPWPAVALFDVSDPRPLVRTAPVAQPVVLAGDGEGIVDAAEAGLLDGTALVLEAAAVDDATLDGALDAGAHLVVTDTNRRRIQTWFYALRDTRGPTEEAGAVASDPTGYDFRLDPFPGTGDDARTVVVPVGGTVAATGGRGPERPEDRGSQALDGDPTTAWRVIGDVVDHHLTVRFDEPRTVRSLRLVQAAPAPGERALTEVSLTLDGGPAVQVELGPSSLSEGGQLVDIASAARRPVHEVRVDLVAAGPGAPGPVGLAEIDLGGPLVAESVRPPVALLRRVGERLERHGLDVVLTRLRVGPEATGRDDVEGHIDRTLELPSGRTFALTGTARRAEAVGPARPAAGDCRGDLLEVDGRAVPVRLLEETGSTAIEACSPLALGAGSHRILAAPGARTGVDIDRLVLSTSPRDRPAAVEPRGMPATEAGAAAERVDHGAGSVDASVRTDGRPFWFVLAESSSEGWDVDVDGGRAGERQMVDGYANGWLITPAAPGSVAIALRWTPQRIVWAGLALSSAAVVICLAIVARTWPRRATTDATLEAHPELVNEVVSDRSWPSPLGLVSVALALLAVAVVAPPVVALVAAGVVVAGWRWTVVRPLVGVVGAAAVFAAWTTERPSLAWLVVALLLVDVAWQRAGRSAVAGRRAEVDPELG